MGEEVRSNYALLSVNVLHKMLGQLDREWRDARTMETRKEVVEIAVFLVTAFGLGLRGEEVVKLDVARFLTYFKAGSNHRTSPHG